MSANWLAIFGLLGLSALLMWLASRWFGRWFNPLTCYSAIWGVCLTSYELQLIRYEQVGRQAWLYILLAWSALYLGAATVHLARNRRTPDEVESPVIAPERLEWPILIICLVGAISVIAQIYIVSSNYGSVFQAIFMKAVAVYGDRTTGELSGLPYLGSLPFAACSLAGFYTALRGKITRFAVFPVLLVVTSSILSMSRMGLMMSIVLFSASYMHAPKNRRFSRRQLITAVGVVGVAAFATLIFVSSLRGLAVDFPGRTPAIDEISEVIPFFPSFYSNFSAPPVALSMYLSSPEAERDDAFWGMYTFAPVFRFLSKFGLRTEVPPYEENYLTPVPMNTSTYLKNVASDFGPTGIVAFPYVLGVLSSLLLGRTKYQPDLTRVFILSSLYLVLFMSFMFNLMVMGDWYIMTVAGVFTCILVQRASGRSQAVARMAAS